MRSAVVAQKLIHPSPNTPTARISSTVKELRRRMARPTAMRKPGKAAGGTIPALTKCCTTGRMR